MMTWTRQVLHVFTHDVRATWLVLVLYAVLLMLGVLQSLDVTTQPFDTGNVALMLLYGSAVLLSVLLVLRHPPAAPLSHWSSLPYARSAVWTAKWLSLTIVLVAMAMVLFLVSERLAMPREWTVEFVAVQSLLFVGLLAASTLVASVEREMRSVLIAMIALPVVLVLVAFVLNALPHSLNRVSRMLANGLGTVPALLVATVVSVYAGLLLYRSQRVSAMMRWSALGGCLLLLASMINIINSHRTMSFSERARGLTAHVSPDPVDGVSLSGELVSLPDTNVFNEQVARAQLKLRLVNAPEDLRSEWVFSEVRTVSRSGDITALRVESLGRTLFQPPLPVAASTRWLTSATVPEQEMREDAIRVGDAWHLPVPLLPNGAPRSARGAVEFREPRLIGRLPVAVGSRLATRGFQIAVLEIGNNTLLCEPARRTRDCTANYENGTLLRLSLLSMLARPEHLSFALINSERGEGIRLNWHPQSRGGRNDHQFLAPDPVAHGTGVLLPEYHGTERIGSAPLPLDERWMQGAELVIVEWVRVGEVPLEVAQ